MDRHRLFGHLLALGTCTVWGTTFISTKVLLTCLQPVTIILFRFSAAWCVLFLFSPKPLRPRGLKSELPFMGAGLTGLTLYFMLENTALSYTLASNVGIIVSVAPVFTAICLWLFGKEPRPGLSFWAGFVIAISGIVLITLSGGGRLEFNPLGDILTLLAAMSWGFYAVCVANTAGSGYTHLQGTRKIFFWGLLYTLPVFFFLHPDVPLPELARPVVFFNLLYLSLAASALCYLAWNRAMRLIGPVATSVYIYLVPVITLTASALILKEPVTRSAVGAIALILLGLWLSQRRVAKPPAPKETEAAHTK